jgi:transmembrane sensor
MRRFPKNMDPDLLIAFLNNETNREETALVNEWIEYSKDNKIRFETLKHIWEISENAFPGTVDVDADVAWDKLAGRMAMAKIPKKDSVSELNKRSIYIPKLLRAAAVVVPLLIAGYLIFSYYNRSGMQTLATTAEIIEATLPDGSLVKLNDHSIIQFPLEFTASDRAVTLTGEAFFNVVPDPERPFIIRSGPVETRVTGTSFNLKAYPDDDIIELYVAEGSVTMFAISEKGASTDSISLGQSEKGIFSKQNSLLEKTNQTRGNELFWANNSLNFSKTRLETVFSLISEKYHVEISMKQEDIGNLRLTTSFSDQPVDSIMHVIAESFNLQITRTDLVYEIDFARQKPD